MPKRLPIVTDELRKTIIEGYRKIGSTRRLSVELAFSETAIKKVLKEASIDVRRHKVEEEIIERLKQLMLNSDMPKIEMVEALGIGRTTFKRICRRLGIKRQTKRRPPPARQSGPMIETMISKYGEEEGRKRYANYVQRMSQGSSGSNNPMYGKPPPQGAGNGWKGWYRDHYFRSLREVAFILECEHKGVTWSAGEKVSIPYIMNGRDRTYRPDFLVGSDMIEIKPLKMHQSQTVLAKMEAATTYCRARGWQYKLIDIEIDQHAILKALDKKLIRFDRDYETRFRAYADKAA